MGTLTNQKTFYLKICSFLKFKNIFLNNKKLIFYPSYLAVIFLTSRTNLFILHPFNIDTRCNTFRNSPLIEGSPSVIINLSAGPPYIEHIFLSQCRIFIKYRNYGTFEIPYILGSDGTTYCLATVEGMFLGDGPIEATRSLTRILFHF